MNENEYRVERTTRRTKWVFFFLRRKITSEKVVEVKVVLCVKENLAS